MSFLHGIITIIFYISLPVTYLILIIYFNYESMSSEFFRHFTQKIASTNLTLTIGIAAVVVALLQITIKGHIENNKNDIYTLIRSIFIFIITNLIVITFAQIDILITGAVVTLFLSVIPFVIIVHYTLKVAKIALKIKQ